MAPPVDPRAVYRLAPGVRLSDNGLMPLVVETHAGERFELGSDLAAGLIRMLEVPRSLADLVEAVLCAFVVDSDVVLRDVDQLCRTLAAVGVLGVVDVASGTATRVDDDPESAGAALSA